MAPGRVLDGGGDGQDAKDADKGDGDGLKGLGDKVIDPLAGGRGLDGGIGHNYFL